MACAAEMFAWARVSRMEGRLAPNSDSGRNRRGEETEVAMCILVLSIWAILASIPSSSLSVRGTTAR